MGMFDDIATYMLCPFCGKHGNMGAQTKDLSSDLFCYRPLDEDWYTSSSVWGRKLRLGLPVFPRLPKDKSCDAWKDQAEKIEAEATIPDEYIGQLNYINVSATFPHCNVDFRGKVKIVEDKLVGHIHDVEKR